MLFKIVSASDTLNSDGAVSTFSTLIFPSSTNADHLQQPVQGSVSTTLHRKYGRGFYIRSDNTLQASSRLSSVLTLHTPAAFSVQSALSLYYNALPPANLQIYLRQSLCHLEEQRGLPMAHLVKMCQIHIGFSTAQQFSRSYLGKLVTLRRKTLNNTFKSSLNSEGSSTVGRLLNPQLSSRLTSARELQLIHNFHPANFYIGQSCTSTRSITE
ncbi:hypothetical protein Mapa_006493 [Marchantia paleacea]|nr:hypothetical protein Mapa_006493 [Marchantia paleacea]